MRLTSLCVYNFRRFTKKTIAFSPEVTVIIGPNTSGKSTILEAIFLSLTGASFRGEKDEDMIKLHTNFFRVQAYFEDKKEKITHEIFLKNIPRQENKRKKSILVNGIKRRSKTLKQVLPVVFFGPEDLDLIQGAPMKRRRYANIVLSQTSSSYDYALRSYQKALKVRNKLLRMIQEGVSIKQDEMEYWENTLIETGKIITKKREEIVAYLNSCSLPDTNFISFSAEYDKSIISRERFTAYFHQERSAGKTLIGPQRDDIVVSFHTVSFPKKILSQFGSRGQQRLGVIWLKYAEALYYQEQLGKKPILLLDDIFSELDRKRRQTLFDILDTQQTIITVQDISLLPENIRKKAVLIYLD